jgi:hypothetical protein
MYVWLIYLNVQCSGALNQPLIQIFRLLLSGLIAMLFFNSMIPVCVLFNVQSLFGFTYYSSYGYLSNISNLTQLFHQSFRIHSAYLLRKFSAALLPIYRIILSGSMFIIGASARIVLIITSYKTKFLAFIAL